MLMETFRNGYYRLPEGLQRAILVKRRERIWIEAGIVFIHVPKAAGTSINQALYGRFMGHVHASDIKQWGSAKLKALPSFAVARNPWDRLVSAYRYARRLRDKDWQSGIGVPPAVRAQIPAVESFESFVRDWLAKRDVRKLNQIFQPQSLFVCDSHGDLLVEHLGRLENLEPTQEFLRRHVGDLPPIDRSNPSGEPVDYRQYYTQALAKLVGEIYSDDVRILRYEFDVSPQPRTRPIAKATQ